MRFLPVIQLPIPILKSGMRLALAIAGPLLTCALSAADGVWMAVGELGRVPVSLHGITAISAGLTHSLALRAEGTVVTWGGYSGNLPPSGLSGVTAIIAGFNFSVALKSDGTIASWGSAPVPPNGLSDIRQIAAGRAHVVALKNDATVVAWGDNANGQATVPPGLNLVTAVAAGDKHTLALRADGSVVAWGDNTYGQATIPANLGTVTAIAAGGSQTAILKADGTVVSWGNSPGTPVTAPAGLTQVTAIAVGQDQFLALKRDGTVVGWGPNYYGSAAPPRDLPPVVAITAGVSHSAALTADGSVVTWGSNDDFQQLTPAGRIGIADIVETSYGASPDSFTVAHTATGTALAWSTRTRDLVPTGLDSLRAVTAGMNFGLALRNDGTVAAWGNNTYDQITIPTGLSDVTAIAAHYRHALALKRDGTLVAWGFNDPSGANQGGVNAIPAGLANVVAIATGDSFSSALKADGTVVSWGNSDGGRTSVPAGLTGVSAITCSDNATLAMKTNGTVIGWGGSGWGEANVPSTLSNVVAIAAGSSHALALKADGTVTAWGKIHYMMPSLIAGLRGVTDIAAGKDTSWFKVPARPINTITIASRSITWDGMPHTLAITTANGRTPTRITYNGSSTPPAAAGTYAVVAETDYMDSYGSATGSLAIKREQTLTFPAPAPAVVTYGIAPIALAGTTTSGLPIAYAVISGPGSINGATLVITGTGSISIQASQTGNDSYFPATSVIQSLSVTKASLTVTADQPSRRYGMANPTLTFTANGLQYADTIATALTGSLATTATTASPVGTYPITIGTLAAANYTLTLAATPALTVQPASLTVTADDQSRIFGAANPTLTTTIAGYQNGETAGVITGSPLLTTTATSASTVGTYPISVDTTPMTAANYTFTGVNGTLTVAAAILTVTATDSARLVGADNPVFTYTITGYQNGQTASIITGSPLLTTTASATSAAGAYPITVNVSGMSAPGYFIVGHPGTLHVVESIPASSSGGGGGGGGCGLGGGLGLILIPALLALGLTRRRAHNAPCS